MRSFSSNPSHPEAWARFPLCLLITNINNCSSKVILCWDPKVVFPKGNCTFLGFFLDNFSLLIQEVSLVQTENLYRHSVMRIFSPCSMSFPGCWGRGDIWLSIKMFINVETKCESNLDSSKSDLEGHLGFNSANLQHFQLIITKTALYIKCMWSTKAYTYINLYVYKYVDF